MITPAVTELPGPVARALDRVRAIRPAAADDAARVLAQALAPVARSPWPEVAWRAGLLTGTGFPVELAWASRDAALRWTCEVAGPEVAEADRLAPAGAAASAVARSPVDLAPWAAVQRGSRLRWGAWLGVRHLDGERRAKVYVELPAGEIAPGPWRATAQDVARRLTRPAWRMAGCNDDGSVELYARVPVLTAASLASVARLVGDDGRLVELAGELIGGPDGELPRPSGVSVALAPSGAPVAVTWFAIATSVWPSDAAVSAALTATAGAIGAAPGSVALYGALSSGPDDGRRQHGMVGAGVDRTGGAWLQAGLRPT